MQITPPPATKGLDCESFTRTFGQLTRWANDYIQSLETRPVCTNTQPGDCLNNLPEHPPRAGVDLENWSALIEQIDETIVPNLVHWQSPGFFAYFPCGSSMPGIAAEFISAVLNVNGMLWSTSPAATELEMRMLDWCAEMFNLPASFRFDAPDSVGGGCIQSTASEGVIASLVSARRIQTKHGHDRSKVTVYTSTQAHSSIVKAAMIAGLADTPDDDSRVRLIETNDDLSMNVDQLRAAIQLDIDNGLVPALVVATVGTTSTGSVDQIDEIGTMLETFGDHRPFFHVDAAWAGAACVCPEHQHLLAGVHHADSLCINPHKWLLTNFDCDLYWVRDRAALVDSMSITPEYLRNSATESGEVIDYRDWHAPLGRRMRALKLWLVIQHFGIDGLQAHIRHQINLAKRFEDWVNTHPALRLSIDRSLALVCFHCAAGNAHTRKLIDQINDSGSFLISHAMVPIGKDHEMTLLARVAVGAGSTQEHHIDRLIEAITESLDQMDSPT